MLEDFYMTGNPCTDWGGVRAYIIAHLPLLQQDLERAVQTSLAKKAAAAGRPVSEGAYTKESRNEMYLEMAAQKEEKEKNERRRMGTEPKEPRKIPDVYNARGEIRQCNEGKYDFNIDDDDPLAVVFELGVPKYLDTSALDVDVNPSYVRCVVREKVTQLKLPCEVRPDSSKVQRSRTTGHLRIEMPKVDPGRVRGQRAPQQPELQPLQAEQDIKSTKVQQPKAAVSVKDIYRDPRRVVRQQELKLLQEVKTTWAPAAGAAADDDDEDDGIPPLDPR